MHIKTKVEGAVLEIIVDRTEKMNALSREMFHQLGAALFRLDQDPELRVALISAAGPNFTSGVDLLDWKDAFSAGTPLQMRAGELDPLGLTGARHRKPLVMAVQGRCYTWGWELLLNTEVRVAASDTRFALLEVARGFYPCGGATLRLPREIGWSNAQRYLLTGDELSAEQAYRLGMVSELCAPGEQHQRAMDIAQRIGAAAPLGVQGALASARHAYLDGEAAEVPEMFTRLAKVMQSDDVKEGVLSFIERRKAVFKGC
jgi:enoyl-CoA hydratase